MKNWNITYTFETFKITIEPNIYIGSDLIGLNQTGPFPHSPSKNLHMRRIYTRPSFGSSQSQ